MKKLLSFLLAFAMILVTIQPVFAKPEWVEYDQDGIGLMYNTYNGSIQQLKKSASAKDTAPAIDLKLETLTIPSVIDETTITSIANAGFFNYDALEKINLPKTLTSVGNQAFYGCDNLKELNLPSEVKTIGKASFASCDSLSKVTLGSSLTTVEEQAFMGCKKLASVKLPDSLTTINSDSFNGTTELKSITLPDNIITINDSAFKGSGLEKIALPQKLKTVPTNAFNGCKNLKEVTISTGVKTIDQNAFANCSNLESVIIPDNCKSIAPTAFDNCPNVVIYCSKGSYAADFAFKNKISYTNESKTNIENNTITVTLDGKPLDFNGISPSIQNGVTLVPMRAIFDALGASITWDKSTKTITAVKDATIITLIINASNATINDQTYTLDAPAIITDGTTLVPVRFISEALGVAVKWDASTRTINLSTK